MNHNQKSYENCQFLNENSHEVLSLFEQELCSRGKVFVYAPSSSWSGKWSKILTRLQVKTQFNFQIIQKGAVRRERHIDEVTDNDHDLLDLIQNYREIPRKLPKKRPTF